MPPLQLSSEAYRVNTGISSTAAFSATPTARIAYPRHAGVGIYGVYIDTSEQGGIYKEALPLGVVFTAIITCYSLRYGVYSPIYVPSLYYNNNSSQPCQAAVIIATTTALHLAHSVVLVALLAVREKCHPHHTIMVLTTVPVKPPRPQASDIDPAMGWGCLSKSTITALSVLLVLDQMISGLRVIMVLLTIINR